MILFGFVLAFQNCLGQSAKEQLYFMADTIHTSKENRIFDIGSEGAYRYYSFYCKCIPSYDKNPAFIYLLRLGTKILPNKPKVNYISWKSLSKLLNEKGKRFNDLYTLVVVQSLTDNKFMMNETKLHIIPPPIIDFDTVN